MLPPQTNPFFSVLFCVNRNSPYLQQALDSVLGQSFGNFEFLIGANPVSDQRFDEELLRILREYAEQDARIKLHIINIPQLAFCLNFLVHYASGEYLARMDADDVCEPNRFAELAAAIERTSPDVIGSWANLINDKNEKIGTFEPPLDRAGIRRTLVFGSAIIHPSVAIRKAFLLHMRGYAGGIYGQDYDLWLRALRAGGKIENLPMYLLNYRIHPTQGAGSRLGRAERVGVWTRELFLQPSLHNLLGFLIAAGKALIGPRATEWIKQRFLGSKTVALPVDRRRT